ncbi:hypothetical protein E2C01_055645 [Portunus trituberculatus]|uniref:Uncharacterized protein n=1 Tax=Portunus trituberculatus TaxID=210409 RepID=A0A5B7GNA4_PORTR|nr:hypothetical protein [Portunus trituberculatus]
MHLQANYVLVRCNNAKLHDASSLTGFSLLLLHYSSPSSSAALRTAVRRSHSPLAMQSKSAVMRCTDDVFETIVYTV